MLDKATALGTIQSVVNSLVNINAPFEAQGLKLLGGLMVIAISWGALKKLLEGDSVNAMIAEFVSIAVTAGIALAFMTSVPSVGKFSDLLNDGFTTIAKTYNPAVGGDAGTAVTSVLGNLFSTAKTIWVGNDVTQSTAAGTAPAAAAADTGDAGGTGDSRSIVGKAYDFVAGAASWAGASIASIMIFLAVVLFKFFISVMILLATLIFCGQYIVTQLMIGIGLALMPLMVPWIMLEATNFIFHGWLKFMITAGLTKVIGAIILTASTNAIEKATSIASEAAANNDSIIQFYAYATVFLLVGIVAFLMLQAVNIANSLMTGHQAAHWNPPGKLGPAAGTTSAGRSASSAANRGAGAAVGGVKGAYNKTGVMAGVKSGFRNGLIGSKSSSSATGSKSASPKTPNSQGGQGGTGGQAPSGGGASTISFPKGTS